MAKQLKQNVKAQVYIDRHIMTANKKQTKETGEICDRPAITIRTCDGVIKVKQVKLLEADLMQDALNPICSGATIWLRTTLDNIMIDDRPLTREYFQQLQNA